jgi:hypothetical protein
LILKNHTSSLISDDVFYIFNFPWGRILHNKDIVKNGFEAGSCLAGKSLRYLASIFGFSELGF